MQNEAYRKMTEIISPFLNKKIMGVFSIGPPLQYNVEYFTFEALIFQKFPQKEFYGIKMQVEIHGFIRPMAKFANFDCFIKSMWNDIYTAKNELNSILPRL